MPDSNDNETGETWWEHLINAAGAGYDVYSKRRQQAAAAREQQLAERRKARSEGATRGSFGAVKRRVKLDDKHDKPCCNGPRGKE